MPDNPICLKNHLPRVTKSSENSKIHDDFTLYLNVSEDLQTGSKPGKEANSQGESTSQHPWFDDQTEAHDDRHPKKVIRRTIDALGSIEFEKLGQCEPGRIHAAPCFDGGYYAVTLRNLVTPEAWREDPVKEAELDRISRQDDPSSSTDLRAALPTEKDAWMPKKSFEAIPCLARLLHEKCFRDRDAPSTPAAGLVLFAGATGSGKTTYLNSVLRRYLEGSYRTLSQKRRPHIVAIGDPVETLFYEAQNGESKNRTLTEIAKHQSGCKEGRPFDFTARILGTDTPSVETALKDCLRETPCAVVVSELRDDGDFVAALDFAATGHLVFATSHSTTLADSLGRLLRVYNADTAAGRAKVAQRVLAVIHHQAIAVPEINGLDPSVLNVPSLWLGNADGRRNLISDGLSSLVSHAPSPEDRSSIGALGRYWVAGQLRKYGMSRYYLLLDRFNKQVDKDKGLKTQELTNLLRQTNDPAAIMQWIREKQLPSGPFAQAELEADNIRNKFYNHILRDALILDLQNR
ncbi:MAG TPA: ATPase, T2SS/T4P/T4SS family [Bryobacteraceae bacterium]|jgi:hypothetical protein|nr:ATPase, T2SS/T4P/T4SS family [Bryobacteraceae bacterium]